MADQQQLRRSYITLPLPGLPAIGVALATFIASRPARILAAQLCLSDTGAGAVTSAIITPTPAASTISAGSTALFTLTAATNTMAGTLDIAVGAGAVVSTIFPARTTIAAAVVQLNAQASFVAADLVAVQGTGGNTNKITITGPVGAAGASTLDLTGTALTETTLGGGPTTVIVNQNGTTLATDVPLSVAQYATVNATKVKVLGTIQSYPGGERVNIGDVITVDMTSVPVTTSPKAAAVILTVVEMDI
jgi:hypothetical protein